MRQVAARLGDTGSAIERCDFSALAEGLATGAAAGAGAAATGAAAGAGAAATGEGVAAGAGAAAAGPGVAVAGVASVTAAGVIAGAGADCANFLILSSSAAFWIWLNEGSEALPWAGSLSLSAIRIPLN